MTPDTDIHNSVALGEFADREWGKALAFLQRTYGIAEDDCKDIFQDAFLALLNNIKAGKLEEMTSSLSTYFLAICKNKAHEFTGKKKSKAIGISDLVDAEIQCGKVEALLALEADDDAVKLKKEAMVRTIVKNMPSPCHDLLWGVYRDNLSMRSLAAMLNYNSEGVVKVTKFRCCKKFQVRYKEMCDKLCYDRDE